MGLVLAGIDEAGYGPLLGPLCVGMAVVRLDAPGDGDELPDLWRLLGPRVSKNPRASGAVAINDSKQLKLANDVKTGHPLMHLERGVLAAIACAHQGAVPIGERALREALGLADAHLAPQHYRGAPLAMPCAWSAAELRIAANLLMGACAQAGVTVLGVHCRAIDEVRFNAIVSRTGSKAEANLEAIGDLVDVLLCSPALPGDRVVLVCDRLGGRTQYAATLVELMRRIGRGCDVEVLEEDQRSRYRVRCAAGCIEVVFQVEGDATHLPVALASMTAKYIRELSMAKFNRFWCERYMEVCGTHAQGQTLKPTAGYRADARRWLQDAAPVLTDEDRRVLVRLA